MVNKLLPLLGLLLICSCNIRTADKKEVQNAKANNVEPDFVEAVKIDSVSFSGLRVYYPHCAVIGLQVGSEPCIDVENICFVCAAAYTGKSIYEHPDSPNHLDIAGDHIMDGTLYKGYDDSEFNTGGFIWYSGPDASWEIVNREEFRKKTTTSPLPFTAFQQELLIYNNQIQKFHRANRANFYRALCNLNGRLCIIDGTREHLMLSFVDLLKNAGVSDALYLDMGGWSYSWYREYSFYGEEYCPATIIHDKPKNGYYGTNWLAFYYVN